MSKVLMLGALMLLAACATVPRGPALTLGEAGEAVTSTSQASLTGLSDDIALIAARQMVRTAIIKCVPGNCVPGKVTAQVEAGALDAQKLSDALMLRARALGKLHGAYAAFAEEARYDAPGDLQGAVQSLFTATNAAATAATAAGFFPAVPALAIAGPIVSGIAGQSAAKAQSARLKAGSVAIKAANARIADIMAAEQVRYAEIAEDVNNNLDNIVATLFENDMADPLPSIAAFEAPLGLKPPAKLPPDKARAAALTIANYRNWMAQKTAGDVYAANVAALAALREEHDNFEAGAPLQMSDVEHSLTVLAGWVSIARGVAPDD